MVIEKINRGKPASIFGEMLTLLEADKRKEEESLQLSYPRDDNERIYIPENLYVIGTMNVADRSIALMDMALRRRFRFENLEPIFDKTWEQWLIQKCHMAPEIVHNIKKRCTELNKQIAEHYSLGPHFKIGHSYVTPREGEEIPDAKEWFKHIVHKQIGPLLREYWVEEPKKAEQEIKNLEI